MLNIIPLHFSLLNEPITLLTLTLKLELSMIYFYFSLCFFALILCTSCGLIETEGESSKVKVEFAKSETNLTLTEGIDSWITPDKLGIAPIAVRIGPTNEGGYMIWGNNNCFGEKGEIEVDDKSYEYYSEHVCTSHEDNRLIELTAGIEAVNAELNSQEWPVPPGSYKFVSIIMCGPGELDNNDGNTATSDVNNFNYQAGIMNSPKASRNCSAWGAEMENAVEIKEGGSVTVEVSYDLNKMVSHYDTSDNPFPVSTNQNDEAYLILDENDESMALGFYHPKIGIDVISARIK